MSFASDTLFIAADGSIKAVSDVRGGDSLFGLFGKTNTVRNVTTVTTPLFRINYPDGYYVVSGDHLICLKAAAFVTDVIGRKHVGGESFIISVEDYLRSSDEFRTNVRGYRAGRVDFADKELSVDPYELGIIFTNEGFMRRWDQHRLPNRAVLNSEDNRRELLAGLADSCGQFGGEVLYLNLDDEGIRRDAMFLAQSLGFTAYCNENDVLEIRGDFATIPAELLALAHSPAADLTYEISIEECGDGAAVSIELDEHSYLLLDDFTVLHD